MDDLGFPVTLWPDQQLPVPQVVGFSEPPGLTEHGWLEWPDGRALVRRELPPEVVLRELLGLELTDNEAVIDFMTQYGAITIRFDGLELPDPIKEHKGRYEANHILDVRFFLASVRDLVDHWVRFMDDDVVYPVWMREDRVSHQAEHLEGRDHLERESWMWWGAGLNTGLRSFPPHVVFGSPDIAGDFGVPEIGLFTALCLQLFNLVQEGLPPKTCENEKCRHRFVRQRGGAEHGQYRTTGVMYCTPECMNAQKQREYRRRKRQEKQS